MRAVKIPVNRNDDGCVVALARRDHYIIRQNANFSDRRDTDSLVRAPAREFFQRNLVRTLNRETKYSFVMLAGQKDRQ